MNPNELFSCVLYIGFLLYFILEKLDRKAHEHRSRL